MKEQINSLNVKWEKKMNEIDGNPWFNFKYKVTTGSRDNHNVYDAVTHGEIVPHPVGIKMTLDQFFEAEKRIRRSSRFLELEVHKLGSPQYDAESVRRVNDFAAVVGGRKTRVIPDATTDMGFGEMYLKIYACRDQSGNVTIKNSTGNKYANEISLYGFTEGGFKRTVDELGLPI
ncbi:MAG: hypothetical protein WC584_01160 [Candidatus Pacearchaeota archaeon]